MALRSLGGCPRPASEEGARARRPAGPPELALESRACPVSLPRRSGSPALDFRRGGGADDQHQERPTGHRPPAPVLHPPRANERIDPPPTHPGGERLRQAAPLVLALMLLAPTASAMPLAYIGPGAGFAAAGSVLVLLGTFLLAFGIVLIWPLKAVVRVFTRRRARQGQGQARGRDRPRRLRSRARAAVHGRGAHAELRRRSRRRAASTPRDGLPVDLAGGLVDLRDRRRRLAAQHLRLPDARSLQLPAGALLVGDRARCRARSTSASPRSRSAARASTACCRRASRSGSCSARAACGRRSSACRSRSRRRSSRTARCSRGCACPTCRARRARSRSTRRKRAAGGQAHRRPAVPGARSQAIASSPS